MPKFIIKYQQQTLNINLPDDSHNSLCLKDLKAEIQQNLLIDHFEVGLNRKEALQGDNVPLKDLGIVPGDRLYVIVQQGQGNLSNTVQSKDVKSGNLSQKSSNQKSVLKEPVLKAEHVSPKKNPEPSTSTSKEQKDDSPEEEFMDSDVVKDAEVNRYLREPVLVRESTAQRLPQILIHLFRDTKLEDNVHEAVFLVLHLLMIETGFLVKDAAKDKKLPKDWKKGGGVYMVHYTLSSENNINVVLMYESVESACKAYYTVGQNIVKFGCELKTVDYIRNITKDAVTTYQNLPKLSRIFKDKVSYPMLQSIHKDTVPSLLNLTTEVQLMILKYLPAVDLTRMSRACKYYKDICSDSVLWRRLYLKKYGRRKENNDVTLDWKKMYKEKYLERKHMREHRRLILEEPPPVWPHVPPHAGPLPPDPGGPFFPPGAIGGDFDRDPMFGGVPGMFGQPGRSGMPPSMLPRPRYDPPGPFPGMPGFRPGRGGGIWEGEEDMGGLGGTGGLSMPGRMGRNNPGGRGFGGFGGGFGGPRFM